MLSPKHMYKPVMEEDGEISPHIVYIREPFRTKIVTVIGTLIVFIATFISGYFTGNMYTTCGIKSFRPSFKEPLQCKRLQRNQLICTQIDQAKQT